jgi:hypothetical protein
MVLLEVSMHVEPSKDTDRIDEAVLALLFLGIFERDRFTGLARAWKGFDWAAMERLHQKGLIHDPVGKAKSVYFTEEGVQRAEQLFHELFGRSTAQIQPPPHS